MEELSDRDLIRVRIRFLDLIKSFFVQEPDAEKMSRWRGTFSALGTERINPIFDSSVRSLSELLRTKSLEQLQDEYYQLFVNPFDGHLVETSASYYLTGRSYGEALIKVRNLMAEASLQKNETVHEAEDSLVVLLDTLGTLVELGKNDHEEEKVRQLQVRIIAEFLGPLADSFAAALQRHEKADFYRVCAKLLLGYLELEKGLVGAVPYT